jgi:hypothetical protein
MLEASDPLWSNPDLIGVCVHRGEVLISELRVPEGGMGAKSLAAAVHQTFLNYWLAGRPLVEAYFQFDGAAVYVATAAPASAAGRVEAGAEVPVLTTPFVTCLLHSSRSLDQIKQSARQLLQRLVALPDDVWTDFRQHLLKVLGKVLNRAQCEKLIERDAPPAAADRSGASRH